MSESEFTQEDYILLFIALNKLDRVHKQELIERLAGNGQTGAQVMAAMNADETLLAIRALKDKLADKIITE